MKNLIIIFIFCLSFAIPVSAISLSLVCEYNSYVQIYDSFGSIIAADFVRPDKMLQINTGVAQLDRVRWIGQDKKIYEYYFDQFPIAEKIVFQVDKNNSCSLGKIESNGMTTLLFFNLKTTVLYQ